MPRMQLDSAYHEVVELSGCNLIVTDRSNNHRRVGFFDNRLASPRQVIPLSNQQARSQPLATILQLNSRDGQLILAAFAAGLMTNPSLMSV